MGIFMITPGEKLEFSYSFANSTNNRMELGAIIGTLQLLKKWIGITDRLTIFSDSAYALNIILEGWYVKWEKIIIKMLRIQIL